MWHLPPPDPTVQLILASQGMSKGLRQTAGPQLVVRPELRFGSLLIGAYFKNVTATAADAEVGAYLGYGGRAGGFDIAATVGYKRNILTDGPIDGEALEISASASRAFGPVTGRLLATWSPDDLGTTGQSLFAEAGATLRVSPALTFGGALGRRERGGVDYTAFNAGLTYLAGRNLTADIRYYDTDRGGIDIIYRARLVGSLNLRF